MKKMIFAAVVVSGLATLASCKKDWTCECDAYLFDSNIGKVDTTFVDVSKGDAQTSCDGLEVLVFGSGLQDCELK